MCFNNGSKLFGQAADKVSDSLRAQVREVQAGDRPSLQIPWAQCRRNTHQFFHRKFCQGAYERARESETSFVEKTDEKMKAFMVKTDEKLQSYIEKSDDNMQAYITKTDEKMQAFMAKTDEKMQLAVEDTTKKDCRSETRSSSCISDRY